MPDTLRIRRLRLFRLRVPLRLKFEHAAAARDVADPVIVALHAAPPYDQLSGWGETLARPYVTGETAESVEQTIVADLAATLRDFSASSFEAAIARAAALPFECAGRGILAARAAVELALIDLAGRACGHPAPDAGEFAGLTRPAGQPSKPRYSGIVIGRGTSKLKWLLRLQRAYGLRDFKIKVAVPDWERRLMAAAAVLGNSISRGEATLRADANGGWSLDQAVAALPLLERCGVCALEQPLAVGDDRLLPDLARKTRIPLMPDESLLTQADAQRLIDAGVGILNIRIAKVGGLIPAWRMASLAASRGVGVQLGCLVGETSLLSAAGLAFLRAFPNVRFAEGAFGRWLLRDDIVQKPVQFGVGGRVKPPIGPGLGVEIDEAAVRRLAVASSDVSI